jgi:uncharacterized protein (TIGR02246 family)
MTRFLSIHLTALFLSVCFAISGSAQSASPEAVVDDFVKAWNSHDAKAFDRLFIDEAIWVPVAEARTEGRTDIVKDFAEIHAMWAKTTTVSRSAMKVQQLRPDVAVILFHAKFVENGREEAGIDRAMVIVAVKQPGGWKIATGQITKQHEGA